MKNKQKITLAIVVLGLGLFLTAFVSVRPGLERRAGAENLPVDAADDNFNQAAALEKLREQIKGREREPADTVFKNIQSMKGVPASRLLAIMEFGYARSLGVSCTHCHTPEDWSGEDKTKKQIAREMAAMTQNINTQLLINVKNIGEKATVNCTTCHRGQTTPALNLPTPAPVSTVSPK
jgi:hypothetical protein